MVGASGALSGLLGLFLLRFPHARIRTAWVVFSPLYGQLRSGVAAIPTGLAIGAWVLLQLVQVGATALGSRDATAYGAHFGGLLMGLLLGLGLHLPRDGWAFSVRHRAERRMAAGDWMGAYEAIHPLIDPDGKSGQREPEDYCLAARACRLLALFGESRRLYRRAVAASLALEDEAGAAAVYAEALRVFPDLAFPEAQLYRLALALDRLGQPRAALHALELFHRLYAGSARLPVVLLRAARLEEVADPDRARELYDEAACPLPGFALRQPGPQGPAGARPRLSGAAGGGGTSLDRARAPAASLADRKRRKPRELRNLLLTPLFAGKLPPVVAIRGCPSTPLAASR